MPDQFDAPNDGHTYGRRNGAWVRTTQQPFATGATSIAGWSITGGTFTLHSNGTVTIDTPEMVTEIKLSGAEASFAGTLDLSICTHLTSFEASNGSPVPCLVTTPPIVSGCVDLTFLSLYECEQLLTAPDCTGLTSLVELNLYDTVSMTTAPNVTGCVALKTVNMMGWNPSDEATIDAFYIQLAANTLATGGAVDTRVTGSGALHPTEASAAARVKLANLGWTITS